jgi:hypothetical protein
VEKGSLFQVSEGRNLWRRLWTKSCVGSVAFPLPRSVKRGMFSAGSSAAHRAADRSDRRSRRGAASSDGEREAQAHPNRRGARFLLPGARQGTRRSGYVKSVAGSPQAGEKLWRIRHPSSILWTIVQGTRQRWFDDGMHLGCSGSRPSSRKVGRGGPQPRAFGQRKQSETSIEPGGSLEHDAAQDP